MANQTEDLDVRGQAVDAQKTARLFGWLFIGTFVTSISAKVLFVNGVGGTFRRVAFYG